MERHIFIIIEFFIKPYRDPTTDYAPRDPDFGRDLNFETADVRERMRT